MNDKSVRLLQELFITLVKSGFWPTFTGLRNVRWRLLGQSCIRVETSIFY